jgi:hypothetical protein
MSVMQEVVRGSDDAVAALSQSGVFALDSAVCYLTAAQLEAIEEDLAEMEESLNYEVTAWMLTDKLGRARRSNDRMPVSR